MTDIEKLKENLSNIRENNDIPEVGYSEYKKEYQKELVRDIKLRNDALEEINKSNIQDRDQRKDFAERIFQFATVYMIFVFLVLFISGSTVSHFHLNDNVLITLLRTTTANVIGVLAIVVTYLFSKRKR